MYAGMMCAYCYSLDQCTSSDAVIVFGTDKVENVGDVRMFCVLRRVLDQEDSPILRSSMGSIG